MDADSVVVVTNQPKRARQTKTQNTLRRQPPYHVILLNDDDHTYEYVIEMLQKLFGHPPWKGFVMAQEVDSSGRVIVDTTTRERAELKRDQIHSYGPDHRLPRSAGSMSAVIEPAVSES